MDRTNANLGKWREDTTARVAGGGKNVMDLNTTFKLGTGEQLTGPAFADQQQREQGPQAHSRYVAITGGRAPSASEELRAATDVRTQQMAIDAARERASAAAGGGSGAPEPPDDSGLMGEEFLKTLPEARRGLIKAIVEYRIDPSKAASMRNPKDAGSERMRLLQDALRADPDYDATQYASRNSLRTSYASGKAAESIRSLNTAIHHLADLKTAAAKLNNMDTPMLNTAKNWLGRQTGDAAATNFKTKADAVVSEMAKVFKGTGSPTDQEIKEWRENLNSSMSPEQINGAVQSMLNLMAGRIAALSGQWQSGMNKPPNFVILTDSSRALLKKLGADPSILQESEITAGGAGGREVGAPTSGARTVSRRELKAMGSSEAEASANGYTVVD
jgi:hypothetical protein